MDYELPLSSEERNVSVRKCLLRWELQTNSSPCFLATAVIIWGGHWWMEHNRGGCLEASLQQCLRVQEITFVQWTHYIPDGECLSVF